LNRAVYIPLSGALMQEKRLEVLANNLANVNTNGFKEDRPVFETILTGNKESSPTIPLPISASRNALTPSLYNLNRTLLAFSGMKTDFSPGALKKTGNPLDLALEGDGFFSIRTPERVMYTRDGSFTLNAGGELVTHEGFTVLGENGKITIDAAESSDISVGQDGTILVNGNEVDKLKTVAFSRPYPLKKVGNSMFSLTVPKNEGEADVDVAVRQGYLELSNVNVVKEMVMMVEVNRAYESYQKVIQGIFDTVNRKTVNDLGRLT